MYDHVAKIEHEPAFAGLSLHAAFLFVILLGFLQHTLGKRVEHAVAGTVADDKVVSKRCYILDVKKQDVFTLFVLQGFDDFMGKF
jgi:hypothetical protein